MSKALSPHAHTCSSALIIVLGIFAFAHASLCFSAVQTSTIEADYDLIFFPTVAHPIEAGKKWEFEIHGCVFENDKHRLALAFLREALELDRVRLTPSQTKTFNERTRLFMVDHK